MNRKEDATLQKVIYSAGNSSRKKALQSGCGCAQEEFNCSDENRFSSLKGREWKWKVNNGT